MKVFSKPDISVRITLKTLQLKSKNSLIIIKATEFCCFTENKTYSVKDVALKNLNSA